jgi:glycosyltransferase involved in cell wall biosynthesis
VSDTQGKLSILHVILAVRETSAPYNEHCLPWAERRNVSICTYFPADLTPPSSIRLFDGDGSLGGFFRSLRLALKDRPYNVIHVHSPHLGLLWLISRLFSGWQMRNAAVVTVHDSFQNYKLRNKLLFLPVFAGFRRVVCCSQASYDSFPSIFKKLAGPRLCVAPNGPDIDRIDRFAGQLKKLERVDGFQVVAIGRMVKVKNPFVLLDAFTRSSPDKDSRLVWIGDGVLRGELIDRSSKMGQEGRIQFTGLIPRQTVFQHLLGSDLFVSTSLGEGLPVSVLEAMACGLPVVLSDIPPHREIAEGSDFIPLVSTSDVEGFAREIARFRSMGLEERRAIGQKCRQLVKDRFSLAAMHARYTDIYSEVTGQRASLSLETYA